MNPMDAAQLARRLMDAHGLAHWRFRFNRRKQALGICNHADRRIELSRYFVRDNGEAAVRDTLLHEIAHALVGAEVGHGPRWRAMCRRIGAQPQRVDREARMPKGDWRATCEQCGREYTRHRRPAGGAVYHCGDCGTVGPVLVFRHWRTGVTTAADPFTGWQADCPRCGAVYQRQRRPARHLRYFCSVCGRTPGPLRFRRHQGT